MKKLFAALIAASFLATPMAASADQHKPNRHVTIQKHVDKKVVHRRNHWSKGNKLTRSERRQIINARDYRRYKLSQPRRGQQWVRVDNQVLLVSAATGLILGLAASN